MPGFFLTSAYIL